ncbi:MAG: flavin reductase family protein, partial [Oscillospiraceae bacterium]|nr:flavin reductase family protein [Candidatus Equicaccousia limihippi]
MFKQIAPNEINDNIFDLIGKEWMLITAGDKNGFNTMTASWGFAGVLWNKPYAACFIRPQRYTREFIDAGEYYTLSFYGENNPIHKICGSKSGRDTDKVKECSLTPVYD